MSGDNMPERSPGFGEVLSMELSEYLDTVLDQIRCKKARILVKEELENHVQEQSNAYEDDGVKPHEAMKVAVRQMGDPIETGYALNRIHRPLLEWKFLFMVLALSILGLALQYFMCYTSLLEGYSGDLAYSRNITAGKVRIYNYLTLFLPLYAGELYRFKTKGYGAVAICYLLGVMPFFIGMKTILVHGSLELVSACFLLLIIAVWKGLFHVNKARTIIVLIAVPLIGLGLLYWKGEELGLVAAYQMIRLKSLFGPDML